ncbi:MAG: GntR family transcriptional regulator [Acidobacteriota bacterium]
MKLWLSRNSEIPIKKQLIAQVMLGIASGDLKPGERLPSTRELARRFAVHQNTISAAYRELVDRSIVEFKKGSGIYVPSQPQPRSDAGRLDGMLKDLLAEATELGFAAETVVQRLIEKSHIKTVTCFLVCDENPQLLEILVEEIRTATGVPTNGVLTSELPANTPSSIQLTALADEAIKLERILGHSSNCIYLQANSVSASLLKHSRPAESDLIAIVSDWADFVELSRLFLLAANIHPNSIVALNAGDKGLARRIKGASTIICDSKSKRKLNGDPRVRHFPVIADRSLAELRSCIGPTDPLFHLPKVS